MHIEYSCISIVDGAGTLLMTAWNTGVDGQHSLGSLPRSLALSLSLRCLHSRLSVPQSYQRINYNRVLPLGGI
jgi:hypothetical protein